MGITEVVRGDDLLPTTPRQVYLSALLGIPSPIYAHVPLVLNESGNRLAKRDGAVTLEIVGARGIRIDVLNHLLSSLAIPRIESFQELHGVAQDFEPSNLPPLHGCSTVEPGSAISRVQQQFLRVPRGHSGHQMLELLHRTNSAGDELIDDKFTFTDTRKVSQIHAGYTQHKLNIYFFSNSS